MTAVVLDGVATSAAVKEELRERIAALRARGIVPGLGTLLVGDDPGSQSYVAGKHRDCAEVGIESIRVDLPATASEEDVMAAIVALNAEAGCVIVTLCAVVQPRASVMVQVQVPAIRPLAVAVFWVGVVFQLKLYGPVPPETATVALPVAPA